MGDRTTIEWTRSDDGTPGATWNPVTGCTKVSPGCDHCYAETLAERFRGTPGHYYENGFDVQLRPDKLEEPLRWKKPRRVFVNSMSDLFHKDIPDEYIAQVFAVMAVASQHTFQVLTKRHARMRSLLSSDTFIDEVFAASVEFGGESDWATSDWPLPNVWLGVSAENQQWADARIPVLLDTPAAVRFVSAEPLLGPINLDPWRNPDGTGSRGPADSRLDWVIAGGESGRGARPMHPDWARNIRDQCQRAGVAFLFKQRGEWTWNEPGRFTIPSKPFSDRVALMHAGGMTAMRKGNPFDPFERGHPNWATRIERVGKKAAGRELDGRTWDEFPETEVTW
jgi:protein gp37